jgi:predicted ATPase
MNALAFAGLTNVFLGNYTAARSAADEAIRLADEKGSLFYKAHGTTLRGLLLLFTNDVQSGVENLDSALALSRSTGTTALSATILLYLTQAHAKLSLLNDARRFIGEAKAIAQSSGERWCDAELHRIAGEIELKMLEPNTAEAEEYFERALSIARAQKARSWELRAAMSMAQLRRDQGKRAQAHDLLAPVYDWFTEGFDTRDLQEAKALLDSLSA